MQIPQMQRAPDDNSATAEDVKKTMLPWVVTFVAGLSAGVLIMSIAQAWNESTRICVPVATKPEPVMPPALPPGCTDDTRTRTITCS